MNKLNLFKQTEVKFNLLANQVLTTNFDLNPNFSDFFLINSQPAEMKIWYLETNDKKFNQQDWQVRYRYHDDCDFELTFKKRFNEEQYNQLIESKVIENLNKKFEPEIDLSIDKQTYSFSYAKTFKCNNELYCLSESTAKEHSIEKVPALFKDWNSPEWGLNALYKSELYGPANAMEYKGTFNNLSVTIEIWHLDEYYPEISFHCDTNKAPENQYALLNILQQNGWLSPQTQLKTELFFNYFTQPNK